MSAMIVAMIASRSVQLSTLSRFFNASEKDEKLTLILDRTNWQFGRSHVNILFLSVVWKGVSVPLFFKFIEDKSQGNSSYIDRIELTEKAIALFGRSRIAMLLGDREFVGKQWILWLRKSHPFCYASQSCKYKNL